jgi:hypothetical protein
MENRFYFSGVLSAAQTIPKPKWRPCWIFFDIWQVTVRDQVRPARIFFMGMQVSEL